MGSRDKAPFKQQDVGQVSAMIEALNEARTRSQKGKHGWSCRKTVYTLDSGRTVDSWKMQDWDYKKDNLPTYARGLFTCKNKQGQPEIVVRGYDKFFNHGEVRSTEWDNVQANTRGPYELSVKENGCIIFIAGMDDGSLIVCSKHSTGGRGDPERAHSVWGERWIDRQLKQLGKTRKDLAMTLRAMNVTAVAELCDDEFEEHVLAYRPEAAGLYLHGINLNLPEFATYPGQLVDEFADEWGFRKVMYLMEDDIGKVKQFLDGVAETGAYAGRDTEGFVIRCQTRASRDAPYSDWFFKYKFEEPYLMYRQWRECTKAIIGGRQPKVKKHKAITEKYLHYARKRLAQDRNLGRDYNNNHGIIALRDDFLREENTTGAEILRQEMERGDDVNTVTENVVLVPIATIGCGKTTLALALSKLFDWGHFQNDNVTTTKGRPQRFAQAVCAELASHPAVIADRNNHQRREREQLIKDVSAVIPRATFVALHFVHDRGAIDGIRRALQERVLTRGDNHQTIQAASDPQKIVGIMEGFLSRFEPVDIERAPDSEFDTIIDLNPQLSSRENLETVVSKLYNEYPNLFGDMPSATAMDEAIEAALSEYKPEIKVDLSKTFGGSKSKDDRRDSGPNARSMQNGKSSGQGPMAKPAKQPKPIFFGIRLPAERVRAILATVFRDKDANIARFYRQLEQTRRVQTEFHVTLIHQANSGEQPQTWAALNELWAGIFLPLYEQAKLDKKMAPQEPELGKCKVHLERLVWDDRIMAFVVRIMNEGTGMQFKTTNRVAHVTVGTASSTVKPKESNDLLARWMERGSGGDTGIQEIQVRGEVLLDGKVIAPLAK